MAASTLLARVVFVFISLYLLISWLFFIKNYCFFGDIPKEAQTL